MKHYLAVDLGATSGRTVLADYDGERVTMREFTRFANPQIPLTGHVYWDLPHLYNEILKALRQVASEGLQLCSIGIDTWGCDFAHFTDHGQLAGLPHCYRDPYTDGAMEQFFAQCMPAKELYQRTGIQFMPFNSVFQLHAQSPRPIPPKTLFIPDALIYMLTGEQVCEYTVASTGQIVNPTTQQLDDEVLHSMGIDRQRFGRMVQPGTMVGTLTPQVQQATGLGPVPVVAVASHDTASAVIAVPAEGQDYAYLSCGTWSLLGIESPHPIITEQSFAQNFTNEGGIQGTTRFLKNICGLWLFENCRREFRDAPQDIGQLSALCQQSTYDHLINPDAPDFAHPASMCQAIADYCTGRGYPAPQTPADYIRCIYRSLAARYKEVLDILQSMSPFHINKLHVIGGGSLNQHLMQMTADATGLPVIAGPSEGTALGNTLVQIGGTLDSMRAIARRSVETKTYYPTPIS